MEKEREKKKKKKRGQTVHYTAIDRQTDIKCIYLVFRHEINYILYVNSLVWEGQGAIQIGSEKKEGEDKEIDRYRG